MRKKLRQPDFGSFQPSEYMRARRPEFFSDSKLIEKPHITREVLEYHLETLTSRKQEYVFEHFCRRLAEKELCPNLLPQTGATAGGDSKTDTETYPVADEIALRWYEGIGREAAQERWAFAISTQKTWKPKVRGDVKKIIQTDRGYSLVYFISNQFIRDKDRAAVEDELSDKHKISVRILDRNWIMKCVFENDRQQLAFETLGLTQYEKKSHHLLGPQDTLKEAELKELEKNIDDVDRYRGVEYQLAEDCMQSALIARNLERPRTEVDGRFDRAEKIAEKVGYRQQRMRIAYIRTWTMYFWFDDINELNKGYDRVEELALGSEHTEDIEKLVNLWMVLATTVKLGQLDVDHAKLYGRKSRLEAELDRLAADRLRPNNALLAKTHKLLLRLHESLSSKIQMNSIIDELTQIVGGNQDNIEYPLDFLLQVIQELGELIPDNSKLDQLIESVIAVTGRRTGKAAAGCLFIDRGYQKLKKGMKYDAIRLFSRAQENLTMHEYQEEFCTSLFGCALAYESAGLLWAARRNVLAVANQSLREFWKHGECMKGILTALQKLVWLELQLGRVPYVLSWMEVASAVAHELVLNTKEQERFNEDRTIQDLVLGLLLLKTELCDLKWLEFIPSVLDRMGLVYSWMALVFALGHEKFLRQEKVIPADKDGEEVLDFFDAWITQPASSDLPEKPELLWSTETTLTTFIIGCHLTIETANEFDSVCLGETIISVLEAFLATGLSESIFSYQPELEIRIRPSEFVTGIPKYRMEEIDGVSRIEIRHATNLVKGTIDQHEAYREWMREIMTFVLCQIVMIKDPETTLEKMAKEGAVFSRALGIVDTDICIKNILGEKPRFCLWAWKDQTKERSFSLQRSVPWFEGRVSTAEQIDSGSHPFELKEEEGIYGLYGIDNLKHRDIQVHSIINMSLWEKAKWMAMAYICPPNEIPGLAIGFTNSEAGNAIFKAWRARFGRVDKEECIGVSIVKGIDNSRPLRYSVVIGIDPEYLKKHRSKTFSFMVCNIHRMDPISSQNLEQFLDRYDETKSYVLLPALYKDADPLPELFTELAIEKQKLRICEAWQLDEHDPDICALEPGKTPIIPPDINDPPVLRAIEQLKKRRERRDQGT